MDGVPQRTGVLIARAWTEGEPKQLKVRITCTLDAEREEPTATAAASIDEALALVRDWLAAVEAGRGDGPVTGA